ncbi:MAG TPA: hypothetical protein VFA93_02895 [Patescibacteria group bacterium]|nr:hypothetical protein [Patescibacteria group bacterium]
MKPIGEIIKSFPINVSTVNKYNLNNGINVISSNKSKYALDRSKFTPNTEEAQLAEEIASFLNDLDNYAFYFGAVRKKGCENIGRLFHVVKADIEEKSDTKYPVRSPKKYFVWKYRKDLY